MNLKRDPLPFVLAQEDEIAMLACLEFFGLEDSAGATYCLARLIKKQCSDGTFPSQFDAEKWGMQETIRHTHYLVDRRRRESLVPSWDGDAH
jgi:hypothetical protein